MPAKALEMTENGASSDDRVSLNAAARALDVSRRTVERMISRGELARDTSLGVSAVTKRSLVAALELRRGEPVDLPRLTRDLSQPAATVTRGVRELVEPLLAQVVDARTRAAEAEAQVRRLEERAQSQREREELLGTLVAGSWRERRRARKVALARIARGPLERATPP